jgi:hypothetical protein
MKSGTQCEHLDALRRPAFIVPRTAISTQQFTTNVLSLARFKCLNYGKCNQWRLEKLEHVFLRVLKSGEGIMLIHTASFLTEWKRSKANISG